MSPIPLLSLILTPRRGVAAKRFRELFSIRAAASETSENEPMAGASG